MNDKLQGINILISLGKSFTKIIKLLDYIDNQINPNAISIAVFLHLRCLLSLKQLTKERRHFNSSSIVALNTL